MDVICCLHGTPTPQHQTGCPPTSPPQPEHTPRSPCGLASGRLAQGTPEPRFFFSRDVRMLFCRLWGFSWNKPAPPPHRWGHRGLLAEPGRGGQRLG